MLRRGQKGNRTIAALLSLGEVTREGLSGRPPVRPRRPLFARFLSGVTGRKRRAADIQRQNRTPMSKRSILPLLVAITELR
jgi:hypothetical protein